MRIGVDIRDLLLARTGARTYLAEVLAALERTAGSHSIVALSPRRAEPIPRKNALDKMREHAAHTWWKQVELPRLAAARGCSVLFCTDFTAPLISRARPVPVFFDGNFWVTPEHYNRLWRILMDVTAIPAARRAPVVVTISEFSRQEIAEHTGIPPERIVAIPIAPKSATTATLTPEETGRVLARYDLDQGTPYVLHVGVMEKRKNLVRLVEAFAQFLQRVSKPYRLVLAGQPGPRQAMDDSANIRAAVARLGLIDSVRFVGHVSDADLPALYQGAAMFVFPSLREGFGIPVLEAFSSRLPVAAANSSAIPEVAGDAALLFDPHDPAAIAEAMTRLAEDSGLRMALVERGLARAPLYSWDRTARELLALFERVAEGRS
jgi:glycosyltransferase involved in cell wall biosynthesis